MARNFGFRSWWPCWSRPCVAWFWTMRRGNLLMCHIYLYIMIILYNLCIYSIYIYVCVLPVHYLSTWFILITFDIHIKHSQGSAFLAMRYPKNRCKQFIDTPWKISITILEVWKMIFLFNLVFFRFHVPSRRLQCPSFQRNRLDRLRLKWTFCTAVKIDHSKMKNQQMLQFACLGCSLVMACSIRSLYFEFEYWGVLNFHDRISQVPHSSRPSDLKLRGWLATPSWRWFLSSHPAVWAKKSVYRKGILPGD